LLRPDAIVDPEHPAQEFLQGVLRDER
jgi:hypothetical protein